MGKHKNKGWQIYYLKHGSYVSETIRYPNFIEQLAMTWCGPNMDNWKCGPCGKAVGNYADEKSLPFKLIRGETGDTADLWCGCTLAEPSTPKTDQPGASGAPGISRGLAQPSEPTDLRRRRLNHLVERKDRQTKAMNA